MRGIDRVELVDDIGRELQARMSKRDIDVYLSGFGIDCKKETSSVNSKWVYVKELLADEADDAIIKIADELGIDHGFASRRGRDLSNSKFWIPGYFRLFLSHVSSFKAKVADLQKLLRGYGISGFVAHEDIEPTKEWQDEIEKPLLSMDALAAILTPGFHESKWTDQELGAAVGRELLVIPIRRGLDPYGFIGRSQGLQAIGRTVGQVAEEIFGILATNEKTRATMADVVGKLFLLAKREKELEHWLGLLHKFLSIPIRCLQNIQQNAPDNEALARFPDMIATLNRLFRKHELEGISMRPAAEAQLDDGVPF